VIPLAHLVNQIINELIQLKAIKANRGNSHRYLLSITIFTDHFYSLFLIIIIDIDIDIDNDQMQRVSNLSFKYSLAEFN
jgi:hypothetical protein